MTRKNTRMHKLTHAGMFMKGQNTSTHNSTHAGLLMKRQNTSTHKFTHAGMLMKRQNTSTHFTHAEIVLRYRTQACTNSPMRECL